MRKYKITLKKNPVTWVLVADSKIAKIYIKKTSEKIFTIKKKTLSVFENEFKEVQSMEMHAEPIETYEKEYGKLGRLTSGSSTIAHISEPHIRVEQEIRSHFAKLVAEKLNQARSKKLFDKLIIAAPAKILGIMTKGFDKKTSASVISKLPKNLTHVREASLTKYLTEKL